MLLKPTVTYGAILSAKKTFLNNPIKKIARPRVKKFNKANFKNSNSWKDIRYFSYRN